ncbi:Pre-mRNA-splicing factor cwc15 [Smittium culicis]|uniref:Pre-mRNA-splicing factor cwc15 n=1 Tax=Smittium culicis TaxID=133412 RepID=A0A1R1XID6_9FUNG|nr:Pre-mRNA-splicing factor cwc15 [Smittium culicis]
MTTAARPTFDTARGKDSTAITLQISARDLPGHTKIKYRQPGQGGNADHISDDVLRDQLLKAEKESLQKTKMLLFGLAGDQEKTSKNGLITDAETDEIEKRNLKLEQDKQEYLKKLQNDFESESENDAESQNDDDSDESDSEDETALLMQELEKIKKSRELEKKAKELEEQEQELENMDSSILQGNPLLADDLDFVVKRRWDDDVVFKNQSRGMEIKPKKRFINDMLRSDFHKKFMKRYIQ